MICCEALKENLENLCEQHKNNCPNYPFHYNAKVREWGIKVSDYWNYEGGGQIIRFEYCPFCGYKFPESLRDKYCDELEKLGLNFFSEDIPEEYKSDKWWNK